VLTCRSINCIS